MIDKVNPFGLPWQAPNRLSGGGAIIDARGREMCQVWMLRSGNCEQRRDFIVEAVNAHYGLLEQIEKLRARVEELEAMFREDNPAAVNTIALNALRNLCPERVENLAKALSGRYCELETENEALAHTVQQFREARYEKLDDLIETVREA